MLQRLRHGYIISSQPFHHMSREIVAQVMSNEYGTFIFNYLWVKFLTTTRLPVVAAETPSTTVIITAKVVSTTTLRAGLVFNE